ncbi:DUF3500 domain-containing protein [Flavicella sediminum]|uniref:DUF3500 domain-containing protein n=1 Tax=Flavicella sediminum TaxID=2585141 RepID=UPI00111DAE6A|nr:DUF3500 domain-containing protein [Flavicella sediminum]
MTYKSSLLFLLVILFIGQVSQAQKNPVISFLNELSLEQRQEAVFPFEHPSKTFWHFLPATMVPREGLQISKLNTRQKKALHKLLSFYLSESGHEKAKRIMSLETFLAAESGNKVFRDPEKYSVAFYGDSEKDKLWSWSFEGHHLSLNFTVLNGAISIAPRFMGANPAIIPSGPRKGERTLHREEDLGFELINSLSTTQQEIAIFQEKASGRLMTSSQSKVSALEPVGISYQELTASQKKILLAILEEYLSSLPKKEASIKLETIQKNELNEIHFAWAGATFSGKGHYYRIQGSSFLIEFDNTQRNANHIHAIWRDFEGDFGRDLIREHYHKDHQHVH